MGFLSIILCLHRDFIIIFLIDIMHNFLRWRFNTQIEYAQFGRRTAVKYVAKETFVLIAAFLTISFFKLLYMPKLNFMAAKAIYKTKLSCFND